MLALLFSFGGRATRRQYLFFNIAAAILLSLYGLLLSFYLGPAFVINPITNQLEFDINRLDALVFYALVVVSLFVYLIFLYFSLAVSVKRLHDRNLSGWWILFSLVPIIGGIWAIVTLYFLPGTRGPNQFGADPRRPLDLGENAFLAPGGPPAGAGIGFPGSPPAFGGAGFGGPPVPGGAAFGGPPPVQPQHQAPPPRPVAPPPPPPAPLPPPQQARPPAKPEPATKPTVDATAPLFRNEPERQRPRPAPAPDQPTAPIRPANEAPRPAPPPPPPPPPPRQAGFTIDVQSPNRRSIRFDKDSVHLGRHGSNDVVFDETNVSRRHAVILRESASRFVIRNLTWERRAQGEQENPIEINGQRVEGESHPLRDGDVVRLGNVGETKFIIRQGGASV